MMVRLGRSLDAEGDFEDALACVTRDPHAIVPRWAIHDRLGHRLARRGDWPRALEHYEAAYAGLAGSSYDTKRDAVFRSLVLLDLSMGRPAHAAARLQRPAQPPAPDPPVTAMQQWPDLEAQIALALKRPTAARKMAELLARQGSPAFKSDASFFLAEVYTGMFAFDLALRQYRDAESLASQRGDTAGAERCQVALARLYVRYAGNLDEAASLFDAGPMRSLEQDPTLRAEWTVLRAYVAEQRGHTQQARDLLAALVDPAAAGQSVHQQVYGGLARLSLRHTPLTGEVLTDFVALVERINPATARLSLLEAVELAGSWRIPDDVDPAPLFDLFRVALDEPHSADADRKREWLVRGLSIAELLKALGRVTDVAQLFEQMMPSGEWSRRPQLLWRRLVIERQLRDGGASIAATGTMLPQFENKSSVFLKAACAIEIRGRRAGLWFGGSRKDTAGRGRASCRRRRDGDLLPPAHEGTGSAARPEPRRVVPAIIGSCVARDRDGPGRDYWRRALAQAAPCERAQRRPERG